MAISWRYADSKEEAVEFLNNGFLKVIVNLKKYKSEIPFELWVRRVLINAIFDQLRIKKRYREKLELRDEDKLPTLTEERVLTENQEDKLEWIRFMTKKLPTVTASVFNLYAFEGFKHAEIAKILGISEGTSHWHYSTAKQKLKEWSTHNELRLN